MALVELKGVEVFTRKQAIKIKQHRKNMQEGIAKALSLTRMRAADRIIENTTPTRNPYGARKLQPSTSGRLTSRTGKLKLMLSYGTNATDPLKSWGKSKGTKLFKEVNSIGLKGQVKANYPKVTSKTDPNRVFEAYTGTYRIFIKDHGWLFSTYGGLPQETKRTLALRFNWETGIRGERRPIFAPVIRQTDFDLKKEIERKNRTIWQ